MKKNWVLITVGVLIFLVYLKTIFNIVVLGADPMLSGASAGVITMFILVLGFVINKILKFVQAKSGR